MKSVYILAYKGKGFIDRLIRWYEWGKYSHTMLAYDINKNDILSTYIYEDAGTPIIPRKDLKPGAREGYMIDLHPKYKSKDIDVYSINIGNDQYAKLKNWVNEQIKNNVKYDYLDFLAFILRNDKLDNPHKFVCSTFIFRAFQVAGIKLLNLPEYKITPTLLCASPLLKKEEFNNV